MAYKLPKELPINLRLKILENWEILEKSQIWLEMWLVSSLPETPFWQ